MEHLCIYILILATVETVVLCIGVLLFTAAQAHAYFSETTDESTMLVRETSQMHGLPPPASPRMTPWGIVRFPSE